MQLKKHFDLRNALDLIVQLIYISNNFFSSFEMKNDVGFIKLKKEHHLSSSDKEILLTYFLDIIKFFSYEDLFLIQDPQNSNYYALTGMSGGI